MRGRVCVCVCEGEKHTQKERESLSGWGLGVGVMYDISLASTLALTHCNFVAGWLRFFLSPIYSIVAFNC